MTSLTEENQLNERARQLLRTLVEMFVRDGQPVGSRTLSRGSGLSVSAATVRNVMADLEELGYVSAPHTSAGRVPTDKGYRLFVDTLLTVEPVAASELTRIRDMLGDNTDDAKALAVSASNLLSGVTQMAGVVTVPRPRHPSLRQIEFLNLSDNRILAILVVNEREVQNRIIQLDRTLSESELRAAANYLNELFAGKDLEDVRLQLLSEMQQAREEMNRAMLDAITMAQQVFGGPDAEPIRYVMAGETNLMDFHELSDVDTLRRLFDAFNRRRDILQLLDKCLSADGVQIFIGQESGYDILQECSVVTAPYVVDDSIIGVLGVIGPTRMAYERVIPIVDVMARLLGSALKLHE